MGEREQEPQIPPSFEVISEQARHDALNTGNHDRNEHGLGYILKRVKQGLFDAAKSLVADDSAANLRGYLPVDSDDHRFAVEYVKSTIQKFEDDPELEPDGWEEALLPRAVADQGWRVSSAQFGRLCTNLARKAQQRARDEDQSGEVVA